MARLFLALLLLLCACAQKRYTEESFSYNPSAGSYAEDDGYMLDGASITVAESAPMRKGGGGGRHSAASAPGAPPPPPPPPAVLSSPDGAPQPDVVTDKPAASPKRMVHYDGFARIRVTKPADMLASAEAIALEAGGRVDRLYGNTITLRVPVDQFDTAWKACLALGDVLDQTVRADDITEQFLAVDLRVKTLRTMQARLIALLAKATEEEEKLRLLQQITRVTEELDGFESQLRALSDLAAMSKITLEAMPRQAFTGTQRPELHGFHWIAQISPFRRAVFEDDHRVGLLEPAGLVTLSKRGPFAAESPDGTVLWTLRLPNDPTGDGPFWVNAIRDRLAESFANLEERSVGGWSCLTLDEAGADAPYRWQICVQPAGKHLNVAQAFYPTPDQVDRYQPRVEGALKGAGGDS